MVSVKVSCIGYISILASGHVKKQKGQCQQITVRIQTCSHTWPFCTARPSIGFRRLPHARRTQTYVHTAPSSAPRRCRRSRRCRRCRAIVMCWFCLSKTKSCRCCSSTCSWLRPFSTFALSSSRPRQTPRSSSSAK